MDKNYSTSLASIFDKKKKLSKKEFTSFIRKRECSNPKITHINHPSCCNETEYVAWRKDFMTPLYQLKDIMLELESTYMEPLLKYDQEHTIPKFRANPCPRDGGDHIDIWYCCSFVELAEYIDWFEKTQLPFGFKNEDFNCFSSINWPHMHLSKKYDTPKDQEEQEEKVDQVDQEMSCSDPGCTHCNIL